MKIDMKKLEYIAIKDQQLVDIRSQHDYRAGYVQNSLNLNPSNLVKYDIEMLSPNYPVVLITGDDAEIAELEDIADILIHLNIDGYIHFDAFPDAMTTRMNTISAADFLQKDHDFILLDVRHPEEITRIAPKKNLNNIPLEHLSDNLERLDSTKEIYTLCGSGNRGTSAASYLAKNGYTTTVIEGGMKAIQAERGF